MVQLGDVIEIESSPEPPPTKSRDKGKGKANNYRLAVIELTDSESDKDLASASTSIPRPSSQKRTNGSSFVTRPAASLDNIPTPPPASEPGPSKLTPLPPIGDNEHERVKVGLVDDMPIKEPIPITLPQPQPIQLPTPPDSTPIPDLDPIPIEKEIDPTSTAIAQILEIIPNVEPTHLLKLIETHLPTFSVFHEQGASGGVAAREATVHERVQGVVGHVLHLLCEDPDYPKAAGKGKGKRTADEEEGAKGKGKERVEDKGKAKEIVKKPKIDYASTSRPFPGGPNYFELALYHLQVSFPQIPKPYLRRQLQINKNLYAPTHLSILAAEKAFEANEKQRPYIIKSTRAQIRKGNGDVAFEEEKAWLDAELTGAGHEKEVDDTVMDEEQVVDAVMDDAEDEEDDGNGIECQCCFADYPFSKMVQCPEAHLFCSTCISTYASTQLGAHNSSLTCIHPSSCAHRFPPSELKRILEGKLYELYERLEQQKEIMQAGLEGLEGCPFCEWKCVVEATSEEDKLFRCGNEEGGCGVVSCRGCKKLDHLPKSCKEVEEDKQLDGRHAIEEAMTRALMRNCPKCKKAFIKELGCNKMSCPNCRTLSCYVCRQVINGYDHFNQQPGPATTSANANKCLLWDAVEERHAQEVKEAAEKAMADYKRDHPDIDESAIKVDIPEAPKKAAAPTNNVPQFAGNMVYPMAHNPQVNIYPGPLLPPPQYPPHIPRLQPIAPHQQQQQRRQMQPVQAPNTRARAAAAQARGQAQPQQQQQAKKKNAGNAKVERARMAAQVRLAEEENRVRQRLDRVREQRVVARMEQQARAQRGMEVEGQRQQPQPQPQPQMQMQLPQVPPQAYGQAHQAPYGYHQHHHPRQQQFQQPQQHPFAFPYPGMGQQQQQPQPQHPQPPPPIPAFNAFALPQPWIAQPPPVAQNPHPRGQGRKKR